MKKDTTPSNTSKSQSGHAGKTPVGAIAGSAIGGIVFIALLCAAGYLWLRRGKGKLNVMGESHEADGGPPHTVTELANAPTCELGEAAYKLTPVELSSDPDDIAELPGHVTRTGSGRGMDGRET